jgi:3-hydroxyacyl-[acyl-carrier protein] dehydratase/trans-2-decenoyl-[acyl-carrier protein] isomerase
MKRKNTYNLQELMDCAKEKLFGPDNGRLPLPPMLMIDRITHISDKGGDYGKGEIIAELDIKKDAWFFDCHFFSDPVMPGSLGVDAMWQLIGFFLGWIGGQGKGRALGCGQIKFVGQVTPATKLITYHVHIKRIINSKLTMGIADATLMADDKVIYTGANLRVGLFTELSEVN